eukprot:CAMPEP_0172313992 /NCGR_PEP_ID=MMETSP1058-20130122/21415_1 /TAXON_ID=83371 /ORGANISM="Detonula confervacea, Strain CCMP 353" /LENGTH=373 /DNA_ID=CAMNT_0013027739 /DNA_START=127 /DNA_END=1248 /DNA_ORIENTATION=-
MGTEYQLRPYDPERESDRSSLEEICANVYGGGDYLPQKAVSYAKDPACSFLALTNNDIGDASKAEDRDNILAVANYKRLPAQNSAWIEAVRTHPDHRNKGLATTLLRSVVDVSKQENDVHKKKPPTNILTCTVQSNKGMLSALEKVGFAQCNTIITLSWAALKQLPGWTPDCDKESQPLLDALNLKHLVSPTAKAIASSSWCTISTEHELLERLQQCKTEGGCTGYLPGLYEYIVPGPNRVDLKRSMEQGLVLALDVEIEGNIEQAILVFTEDERISSLKSNWVCSIVAHTQLAFEAAVWHAHSLDVARRMQSFQQGEGNNDIMDTENAISALPFCLVFDDAVPLEKGTLAHALPRVTDECVVFSYDHEGSES